MCISLVWDDVRCLWECTFQDTISGQVFKREAPVVVSAVGTLDRPYTPSIEGSESFQGKTFHSATWDDRFQAKGKQIAVLGNGASATQFVPELVKHVGPKGKVMQFVRSVHWWTERDNQTYSEAFKLTLYMNSRGEAMRQNIREKTFRYINTAAPPEEYREILKPDYEPGCKRHVNTAIYLASLHSPQIHLTKDPVVKIGANHIETAAGHRKPIDAIIYATGFQTQKWLSPIQIKGVDGKALHGIWDAARGAGI